MWTENIVLHLPFTSWSLTTAGMRNLPYGVHRRKTPPFLLPVLPSCRALPCHELFLLLPVLVGSHVPGTALSGCGEGVEDSLGSRAVEMHGLRRIIALLLLLCSFILCPGSPEFSLPDAELHSNGWASLPAATHRWFPFFWTEGNGDMSLETLTPFSHPRTIMSRILQGRRERLSWKKAGVLTVLWRKLNH